MEQKIESNIDENYQMPTIITKTFSTLEKNSNFRLNKLDRSTTDLKLSAEDERLRILPKVQRSFGGGIVNMKLIKKRRIGVEKELNESDLNSSLSFVQI